MSPSHTNVAHVPLVDISRGIPEAQLAKQLVTAAIDFGFVYIRDQGRDIPNESIDRIFALSQAFFASSKDEKSKCKLQEKNRGWIALQTETLDRKNQRTGDFKEALNLTHFVDGKPQQPLSPTFVGHEGEVDQFFGYCHNLVLKLLALFGIGLEIHPEAGGSDWLVSRHTGYTDSILRLLYYPSIAIDSDYNPSVDIRAGAHSDYGSITLLFQRPGQPGLELLPRIDGNSNEMNDPTAAWEAVAVYPAGTETDPNPPILVNIGDLLSYWTNGLLKSTVHRVVFPRDEKIGGNPRYSIAYFAHPTGSTLLDPIPSRLVQEKTGCDGKSGNDNKPMTASQHLMNRLEASYL